MNVTSIESIPYSNSPSRPVTPSRILSTNFSAQGETTQSPSMRASSSERTRSKNTSEGVSRTITGQSHLTAQNRLSTIRVQASSRLTFTVTSNGTSMLETISWEKLLRSSVVPLSHYAILGNGSNQASSQLPGSSKFISTSKDSSVFNIPTTKIRSSVSKSLSHSSLLNSTPWTANSSSDTQKLYSRPSMSTVASNNTSEFKTELLPSNGVSRTMTGQLLLSTTNETNESSIKLLPSTTVPKLSYIDTSTTNLSSVNIPVLRSVMATIISTRFTPNNVSSTLPSLGVSPSHLTTLNRSSTIRVQTSSHPTFTVTSNGTSMLETISSAKLLGSPFAPSFGNGSNQASFQLSGSSKFIDTSKDSSVLNITTTEIMSLVPKNLSHSSLLKSSLPLYSGSSMSTVASNNTSEFNTRFLKLNGVLHTMTGELLLSTTNKANVSSIKLLPSTTVPKLSYMGISTINVSSANTQELRSVMATIISTRFTTNNDSSTALPSSGVSPSHLTTLNISTTIRVQVSSHLTLTVTSNGTSMLETISSARLLRSSLIPSSHYVTFSNGSNQASSQLSGSSKFIATSKESSVLNITTTEIMSLVSRSLNHSSLLKSTPWTGNSSSDSQKLYSGSSMSTVASKNTSQFNTELLTSNGVSRTMTGELLLSTTNKANVSSIKLLPSTTVPKLSYMATSTRNVSSVNTQELPSVMATIISTRFTTSNDSSTALPSSGVSPSHLTTLNRSTTIRVQASSHLTLTVTSNGTSMLETISSARLLRSSLIPSSHYVTLSNGSKQASSQLSGSSKFIATSKESSVLNITTTEIMSLVTKSLNHSSLLKSTPRTGNSSSDSQKLYSGSSKANVASKNTSQFNTELLTSNGVSRTMTGELLLSTTNKANVSSIKLLPSTTVPKLSYMATSTRNVSSVNTQELSSVMATIISTRFTTSNDSSTALPSSGVSPSHLTTLNRSTTIRVQALSHLTLTVTSNGTSMLETISSARLLRSSVIPSSHYVTLSNGLNQASSQLSGSSKFIATSKESSVLNITTTEIMSLVSRSLNHSSLLKSASWTGNSSSDSQKLYSGSSMSTVASKNTSQFNTELSTSNGVSRTMTGELLLSTTNKANVTSIKLLPSTTVPKLSYMATSTTNLSNVNTQELSSLMETISSTWLVANNFSSTAQPSSAASFSYFITLMRSSTIRVQTSSHLTLTVTSNETSMLETRSSPKLSRSSLQPSSHYVTLGNGSNLASSQLSGFSKFSATSKDSSVLNITTTEIMSSASRSLSYSSLLKSTPWTGNSSSDIQKLYSGSMSTVESKNTSKFNTELLTSNGVSRTMTGQLLLFTTNEANVSFIKLLPSTTVPKLSYMDTSTTNLSSVNTDELRSLMKTISLTRLLANNVSSTALPSSAVSPLSQLSSSSRLIASSTVDSSVLNITTTEISYVSRVSYHSSLLNSAVRTAKMPIHSTDVQPSTSSKPMPGSSDLLLTPLSHSTVDAKTNLLTPMAMSPSNSVSYSIVSTQTIPSQSMLSFSVQLQLSHTVSLFSLSRDVLNVSPSPSQQIVSSTSVSISPVVQNIVFAITIVFQQEFTDNLTNPKSSGFKTLAEKVVNFLDEVYSTTRGYIKAEVLSFSSGSVVANTRVIFERKSNLTTENITNALQNANVTRSNSLNVTSVNVTIESIFPSSSSVYMSAGTILSTKLSAQVQSPQSPRLATSGSKTSLLSPTMSISSPCKANASVLPTSCLSSTTERLNKTIESRKAIATSVTVTAITTGDMLHSRYSANITSYLSLTRGLRSASYPVPTSIYTLSMLSPNFTKSVTSRSVDIVGNSSEAGVITSKPVVTLIPNSIDVSIMTVSSTSLALTSNIPNVSYSKLLLSTDVLKSTTVLKSYVVTPAASLGKVSTRELLSTKLTVYNVSSTALQLSAISPSSLMTFSRLSTIRVQTASFPMFTVTSNRTSMLESRSTSKVFLPSLVPSSQYVTLSTSLSKVSFQQSVTTKLIPTSKDSSLLNITITEIIPSISVSRSLNHSSLLNSTPSTANVSRETQKLYSRTPIATVTSNNISEVNTLTLSVVSTGQLLPFTTNVANVSSIKLLSSTVLKSYVGTPTANLSKVNTDKLSSVMHTITSTMLAEYNVSSTTAPSSHVSPSHLITLSRSSTMPIQTESSLLFTVTRDRTSMLRTVSSVKLLTSSLIPSSYYVTPSAGSNQASSQKLITTFKDSSVLNISTTEIISVSGSLNHSSLLNSILRTVTLKESSVFKGMPSALLSQTSSQSYMETTSLNLRRSPIPSSSTSSLKLTGTSNNSSKSTVAPSRGLLPSTTILQSYMKTPNSSGDTRKLYSASPVLTVTSKKISQFDSSTSTKLMTLTVVQHITTGLLLSTSVNQITTSQPTLSKSKVTSTLPLVSVKIPITTEFPITSIHISSSSLSSSRLNSKLKTVNMPTTLSIVFSNVTPIGSSITSKNTPITPPFNEFRVQVILTIPLKVDIANKTFIEELRKNLETLFDLGLTKTSLLTRKRRAINGKIFLHNYFNSLKDLNKPVKNNLDAQKEIGDHGRVRRQIRNETTVEVWRFLLPFFHV